MRAAAGFPHYTAAELAVDRVLHAFAILLAVGGVAWLFEAALPAGGLRQLIGLTLYGVGRRAGFRKLLLADRAFLAVVRRGSAARHPENSQRPRL